MKNSTHTEGRRGFSRGGGGNVFHSLTIGKGKEKMKSYGRKVILRRGGIIPRNSIFTKRGDQYQER